MSQRGRAQVRPCFLFSSTLKKAGGCCHFGDIKLQISQCFRNSEKEKKTSAISSLWGGVVGGGGLQSKW